MKLCKILLPGLLSMVFLSSCSLFNRDEDTAAMSPLPKIKNQFTLKKIWSVSVGSGTNDYYSYLRPTWQGSSLFAADRKGLVKAVNLDTGKEIWQKNLSEKMTFTMKNRSAMLSGGLTVKGNNLYVGSEKATVYALHTDDGRVLWETPVAGEALSHPVVSDGLVLIHTSNGMLQALDEENGAIKWMLNLGMPLLSLRGESAPSTAFSAAIIGGDNGRISAITMKKGQLIWQQPIAKVAGASEIDRLNDVDTPPVVVDNIVYAIAYNRNLTALDLRSGQILWQQEIGSVNDFIVDNSRIYLVDQNDRIVALKAEGGLNLWSQNDLLHRNLTAPVIYSDDYLVVADSKGYLHWINKSDGRFVAQQQVDSSGFLSAPIIADNKLIIQAKNGTVYAFALIGGQKTEI